jgi:hypothetical protein
MTVKNAMIAAEARRQTELVMAALTPHRDRTNSRHIQT